MSTVCLRAVTACAIVLGFSAVSVVGDTTTAETLSIGRAATPADIARWDIDIGPDGAGLPPGNGDARRGASVYAERCAGCHGTNGRKGRDKLAGPPGDRTTKTVGSFWPYATTLFDYIRRAMPPAAPGSLSDADVYALTAYILTLNAIITPDHEMNAESLPKVSMPARGRFVPDNRRGGAEVR